MPGPGRRFLQVGVNNHSMSSPSTMQPQRLQRCFVCYNEFTPFKLTTDKWESNMIKMFYSALNLPAPDDGGDDEDEDPIISLPFCPQCHSKISVMSSLHGQLQLIQAQFSNIRNDVVFKIVETNGQNCRKGPMDFIRQQIYDKWKPRYDDAQSKGYFDQPVGLEAIANEAVIAAKRGQDEFLYPEHEDSRITEEFSNSMGLPVSPFGGVPTGRFANSTPNVKALSNSKRPIKNEMNSHDDQSPASKRPARTAATANFLQYNESSSVAKFREMESVAKSMGNPAMPRLIPMGMHGTRGKRGARNSGELNSMNVSSNSHILEEGHGPNKDGAPQNSVRRVSAGPFPNKNLTRFGRMKPGPKRQIPAKMKFQPSRRGGRPGRPVGWRKPPFGHDFAPNQTDEVMDTSENTRGEDNSMNEGNGSTLTNNEETDNSMGGGTFSCRLCPKSYYNISRLRRHESLCHPTTKALQCALCPNGFSSILAFRRHMQNQHHQSMIGISTMTCAICRKSFVKQSAFDYHMTTHESVHHRAVNPGAAPRKISGHPTRKKPGPKPRIRELSPPIVADDDLVPPRPPPTKAKPEEKPTEQNEADSMEVEETEETEDVSTETPIEPEIKPPVQKKKKTFFSGTRKRKRRRIPKTEDSESGSVSTKKEPASDRVIIPRKKYQHVAPVRKSMRRADSSATSGTEQEKQNDEENKSENKTVEPKKEESAPISVKESGSPAKKVQPSKTANSNNEGAKAVIPIKEETMSPQKGKKEIPLKRSVSKEDQNDDDVKVRIKCPVCSLEYPFIGLLVMHVKGHLKEPPKCVDCAKEFPGFKEYNLHIVNEHNRELIPCPTCDEEFANEKYLALHDVSHRSEAAQAAAARQDALKTAGAATPRKVAPVSVDEAAKSKSLNNDSTRKNDGAVESSNKADSVFSSAAASAKDEKEQSGSANGPKAETASNSVSVAQPKASGEA